MYQGIQGLPSIRRNKGLFGSDLILNLICVGDSFYNTFENETSMCKVE